MKQFNKKIINIIFAILGIMIIVYLLYKMNILIKDNQIDIRKLSFNYGYLLLSFLMIPIWFSIRSFIWKYILKIMDEDISLIDSMRLIGLSNLGKYIPGKVWFTVGRAVLAERLGISRKKSFTSIIWDTYFILLISFSFLLILILKINMNNVYFLPVIILLLIVLIPLSIPNIFKRIINLLLKILKKQSIDYNIRWKAILLIILLDILMWSLQGLQFLFLLKSLYSGGINNFTVFLIYPAAWAMGFIILVMPAGIGIREGLIAYALMQTLPQNAKGMAIIIAVLSRIQFTLAELSYLITLIGSKKIWRSNEKG